MIWRLESEVQVRKHTWEVPPLDAMKALIYAALGYITGSNSRQRRGELLGLILASFFLHPLTLRNWWEKEKAAKGDQEAVTREVGGISRRWGVDVKVEWKPHTCLPLPTHWLNAEDSKDSEEGRVMKCEEPDHWMTTWSQGPLCQPELWWGQDATLYPAGPPRFGDFFLKQLLVYPD